MLRVIRKDKSDWVKNTWMQLRVLNLTDRLLDSIEGRQMTRIRGDDGKLPGELPGVVAPGRRLTSCR